MTPCPQCDALYQLESNSWAGGYSDWDAIPLDAILNHFLVWCILLGSSIEEEVLRIQDKLYTASYFSLRVAHAITH